MTTSSTAAPVSDADTSAHLAAGPRIVGDRQSFPSHAELSRTIVEPGVVASLATLTADGHPYASLVPVSTPPGGSPLVCISALAEHTCNLRRDQRASLLAAADVPVGADPLAHPRVTLVGRFVRYEPTPDELAGHLTVHPHARDYVDFDDFAWWRLEVSTARHVGGFGVMGWATGAEFDRAPPDPVIPHAAPMIAHLNDDHADACVEIVRRLAGVRAATAAVVTAVDRYGLTLDARVDGDDGAPSLVARVAFAEPLHSPQDVRAASVELVRRARTT